MAKRKQSNMADAEPENVRDVMPETGEPVPEAAPAPQAAPEAEPTLAEKEEPVSKWASTLDVKEETAVAVKEAGDVAEAEDEAQAAAEETAAAEAEAEEAAASMTQNGVKRLAFAGIAILLQIIVLILIVTRASASAPLIEMGTRILAIALVLGIYSKNRTSSLKMPWIILILTFPILGVTMYLLNGNAGTRKKMRLRYALVDKALLPKLPQNHTILSELKQADPGVGNVASYVKSFSGFPVYRNTDTAYYPDARAALDAQLEAMRGAKRFIFLEYHAIEETAESFHEIEEVLEERVQNGVEVRIFYDDMGSIGFINTDFIKRMEEKGIACRVFNPFSPVLNLFLNNRDHRKMTIIDGIIGFTGGYNLADEYFNITQPYGHWKDTGIRLTGDAVRTMTMSFLEMWNAVRDDDVDDRVCDIYLEPVPYEAQEDCCVQPYADSPMDHENIGENVYISMIEQAVDYIWFMTPYLIITDEMSHALSLAAKRGVDVRILTPGIPDKKTVYSLTRSYYHSLAANGVRIFEYTPGFLHAKQCVTDDKACVCGTINLDYRSLYHHFENGCLIAGSHVVDEMKQDFEETIAQCREVTEEYRSGLSSVMRIKQLVLRLFASLL